MSAMKFQYGDTVRHAKRPEWGIGSVVKAEDVSSNGEYSQRLSVRFPNAGLKTINTSVADLEVIREDATAIRTDEMDTIDDLHRMSQTDWLAPLAQKKIDALMVSLPEPARDVFRSLESRLKATLDLYRFDKSGRGLIDWAVAQSGLADPLSRFSRHELEQHFDRWSHDREQHLGKLLQEAASDPSMVRKLLEQAPPDARRSSQRLSAVR